MPVAGANTVLIPISEASHSSVTASIRFRYDIWALTGTPRFGNEKDMPLIFRAGSAGLMRLLSKSCSTQADRSPESVSVCHTMRRARKEVAKRPLAVMISLSVWDSSRCSMIPASSSSLFQMMFPSRRSAVFSDVAMAFSSKEPHCEYRRVQRRYSKDSTMPASSRSELKIYSSMLTPPETEVGNKC